MVCRIHFDIGRLCRPPARPLHFFEPPSDAVVREFLVLTRSVGGIVAFGAGGKFDFVSRFHASVFLLLAFGFLLFLVGISLLALFAFFFGRKRVGFFKSQRRILALKLDAYSISLGNPFCPASAATSVT